MPALTTHPPLPKAQQQLIKALATPSKRHTERKFVVEGKRSVEELCKSPTNPCFLVATPDFLAKHPTLTLPHPLLFTLPPQQFQRLCTLTTNEGILAVAPYPAPTPLPPLDRTRLLILDRLQNPRNLGALLRVAHWYGIYHLIASPDTVDQYNPKTIQASMGSFLAVTLHYAPLRPFLQSYPHPIIGALLEGTSLYSTPLPPTGALVIGNEATGISADLRPLLTHRITIPPRGSANSLNAAVAAGILCDRWTHPTIP